MAISSEEARALHDPFRVRALEEDLEDDPERVYSSGALYRAGHTPPPGLYRQVDGPRTVVIETEGDVLPPSFDGHVACYRRVDRLWGQIGREDVPHAA